MRMLLLLVISFVLSGCQTISQSATPVEEITEMQTVDIDVHVREVPGLLQIGE